MANHFALRKGRGSSTLVYKMDSVLNSYRNFTPHRFNKRNNIKVLFVYNKEGYWREAKKECKSVTESDDNNYNVGDSPEHDLGVM